MSDRDGIGRQGEPIGHPVPGCRNHPARRETKAVIQDRFAEGAAGKTAGGIDQGAFKHVGAESADQNVRLVIRVPRDQVLICDMPDVECGMSSGGLSKLDGKVHRFGNASGQCFGVFGGSGVRILFKPFDNQENGKSSEREPEK